MKNNMNWKLSNLITNTGTIFIVIGVLLKWIIQFHFLKADTNTLMTIDILGIIFLIFAMILLIIDTIYIHLFYNKYSIMVIEICFLLGAIAVLVLLPFKTFKWQLGGIFSLLLISFIIARKCTFHINKVKHEYIKDVNK
jgi:hypothetical protein